MDEEHSSWEAFFAKQGPYAHGGAEAIARVSESLRQALLTFVRAVPSVTEALAPGEAALLPVFERVILRPVTKDEL